MKRFLLVLTFATLLSACDVAIDTGDNGKEKGKSVDSVAVGFQAYVNRATKAGQTGDLTTDILKSTGFGVLGYTSNSIPFNERSTPDFMYNQPVTCPSGTWTYEPVKYWPNEENDRVSFFAYAPFVEVTSATGLVTAEAESGILGLSHYLAEGDPQVWYRTTLTPGKDVDLCWGNPFLNQAKQKTNERLQFEFHHALSQLNVQIDADIDAGSQTTTRIYVRSVTFTGFMTQGTLNLNSTGEPIWDDISGTERPRREPVTITDGRIDGEEGRQGAVDVNEKLAKLNPLIIQSKPYEALEIDGVTETPANLFNETNPTVPVLVVPLAGTPMSVTIVYDVETVDNSLGLLSDGVTHGISIENRITRQVLLDNGNPLSLEAGKKYTVKLHLGLTSVQFDANVADWDNSPHEGTANLPINTTSLGKILLTPASTTIWVGETANKPVVSVKAGDGGDLAGATVTWMSNRPEIASVDEATGDITVIDAGVATITATARYEDQTATADFVVYVNKVSGIKVEPATSNISLGGTVDLTATLIYNGDETNHTFYGLETISSWPTVTWSSGDARVSVPSTPGQASGNNPTVTTTASTTDGATAGLPEVIITATVGTDFVKEAVSGISKLTCVEPVTIASVTISPTTKTVWKADNVSTPSVSVLGSNNQELPATISWSCDSQYQSIATVENGVISLHGAGDAVIVATAEYEGSSKSAEFTLHVNEVTGISITVDPTSATIAPNGTATLTATLAKTNYGDVSTLTDPTISWSSASESYVTVSPAEGGSTVATGVAAGSSIVTASISSDYIRSGISNEATCTISCVAAFLYAYRGYEVSPGVLYKKDDGTFDLTNKDGNDPFEMWNYYGKDENKNKYYFQFETLKSSSFLGKDGNNIKSDSDKLPTGWIMPSQSIWETIYGGAPQAAIQIEKADGTVESVSGANKGYAFVKIQKEGDNNDHIGLLLLRDGTFIPKEGNLQSWGSGSALNELTYNQYLVLKNAGCLFIESGGFYFTSFSAWIPPSYDWGYYLTSTYHTSVMPSGYYFKIEKDGDAYKVGIGSSNTAYYIPVRLVHLK